jgi:Xaa-Pro aminopeptidase
MLDRLEYRTRRDRLHAAMAAAGLDALVIGGRGVIAQNGFLIWLIGYCPVIRPAYAVLLPGREPVLLVTTPSDLWLARRQDIVDDIRVLAQAEGDAMGSVAALRALLADCGAHPRVGVVGLEDIVPAAELLRWQAALPAAQFESATNVMWGAKAVKSPRDIEAMRGMAAHVDTAFSALVATLAEGGTQAAAAGAAEASLRAAGAVEILVYVSSFPHFLHRPQTVPPPPGSLVTAFVEASDTDGYWVELARLISVGPLDRRRRHVAEHSLTAMQCAEDSLRPSRTGGAAYAAIAQKIGAAGLTSGLWYGHGVGVDHDLPVIGHGNDTVLEPGMVVALHPHIVDADNEQAGNDPVGACLGDTFVISEGGATPLSAHPRDIVTLP